MAGPQQADAPHLLLIAFYFPPARASGVFRARAIANHFVSRGWRVTVLTAGEAFFDEVLEQSDHQLLSAVDPAVRIRRVPFDGRRFDRRLRNHGWFRGNFPRIAERRMQRRAERTFPDPYAAWIDQAVKAAIEEHDARPVGIILATGNPFSSFEVARRMGERTGRPFVLDYRDGWTLDQFAETEAFPPEARVWAAERSVLTAASKVVFVNSAQRRWYAERYPEVAARMMVVPNGYDADLLGDLSVRASPPTEGLRLGYVGTITRHLPWDVLFSGWQLVRDHPELEDAQIDLYGHLGFFTHSQAGIATLLPTSDRDARVVYHGPLPKHQVADAYRSLDVLLLVTPDSQYVTCQKVYEYMAFGKPIVSVNDPRTNAREPLDGYPLAFNVDHLDAERVAAQLLAAARAARLADPSLSEASKLHAQVYERGRQLESLEEALAGLVDG